MSEIELWREIGQIKRLLDDLKTRERITTIIWTDYSATSTIVGWSSYTQKNIWYCRIGNIIFVKFYISGTSNSATTTFTVPTAPASPYTEVSMFGVDNGVGVDCRAALSAPITFYTGKSGAAGWTASGTKLIIGEFFYQI